MFNQPGFNAPEPDDPLDREIWNSRAALLDAFVYPPVNPDNGRTAKHSLIPDTAPISNHPSICPDPKPPSPGHTAIVPEPHIVESLRGYQLP